VQKLSDLSRSPPRTAGGNGPAVRACSSRYKGRGRALGGSASPYLRPEDRVSSQRHQSRRLRAGVPVPPQVAGSCRNGSNPPLAAPRLSGAAMPPRQPQNAAQIGRPSPTDTMSPIRSTEAGGGELPREMLMRCALAWRASASSRLIEAHVFAKGRPGPP
jgi:hypothetical protein